MKLTSSQTYKLIYYVLEHRAFTQLQASKSAGISLGQTNKIVQWLVQKRFAEKRSNKYYLADPSGLVGLFALERDMNSFLAKKISVNLSKEKVLRQIPKSVLCLDSALEKYSNYYRSNRVCVYINSEKGVKEIEKTFQDTSPGHTEIWLFKASPESETIKLKQRIVATKLRTLIDLVCDNKTFYAKDLFKQLWGVKFLES
ncbi:MAG: hypothetical protein Q7S21_03890 [archaeon]|nr:hypothetical protein [archaeon]